VTANLSCCGYRGSVSETRRKPPQWGATSLRQYVIPRGSRPDQALDVTVFYEIRDSVFGILGALGRTDVSFTREGAITHLNLKTIRRPWLVLWQTFMFQSSIRYPSPDGRGYIIRVLTDEVELKVSTSVNPLWMSGTNPLGVGRGRAESTAHSRY
jgi:hypothetical protein